MKKILSMLLTLCLLVGAVPPQALAYAGDIRPPDSTAQMLTRSDGTLVLQNGYLRAELHRSGTSSYLTTSPAALTNTGNTGSQTPYCEFITFNQGAQTLHSVTMRLKNASFTNQTPNGSAKAIKAEYALTVPSQKNITATATVYHTLVQLSDGVAEDTWGVLTSVQSICIDRSSFPENFNRDFIFRWGYTLNGFTGMGHPTAMASQGGPALKLDRITVPEKGERTVETTVLTAPVQNMNTEHYLKGYAQAGVLAGRMYITEAYVDGYPWANPFVGLSGYGEIVSADDSIRTALPQTVSAVPSNVPASTAVICRNFVGFGFSDDEDPSTATWSFLWGFRDLSRADTGAIPSEPDKVDSWFAAQRLAAFASGEGITVEYVADDAALETLKKQYGASPVALISGSCESANGTDFLFTHGAALLSPSVTATWDITSGGKLILHRDGTIEQHGVSLNAPTFKFYQPQSGAETSLNIALTKDGFSFDIDPDKNDAVISVDIPYASAKLEHASADAAGNLVFSGDIGFRTIFDGAEFSLEKLGYGLQEKTVNGKKVCEFKVNGVHATGSFDTADLMSLELASVEGEVNTFKGQERYAFSLELNAFDLFETEAELALTRSKKDGSLIPNDLWFYVKANPGIVLIPPVPVGQLNGGGAGFKNLAATVNGDYFAIPPLVLRGALTGTYLHLIEGTGEVQIGPSRLALQAKDVGFVGAGDSTKIIDSFGYALSLDGQERNYRGTTYKGIYFSGSESLKLNLPNKSIDLFVLDSSIKMGAFGGVNDTKDRLYLGIGANGTVVGTIQIPSNCPVLPGHKLAQHEIQLIVGGQTTVPLRGVSVSEGMQQAFRSTDVYLGAMTQLNGLILGARAWVIVPNVIQTNFRRGEGWDVDVNLRHKFDDWDWEEHGVAPVVQNSDADTPVLFDADAPANPAPQTITVNADAEETPYILLAFDKTVSEEQIKQALQVSGESGALPINWVGEDGLIDPSADINAATDILKNTKNGTENRVAILRLKNGGTYSVSADALDFFHQEAAVAPFEELSLSQSGSTLSGEIKYPESGTAYVLRTYFGSEAGEAAYLVDEQTISSADADRITVSIPDSGALAPTGEYHVTSFLMTEKQADSNGDGELESTLFAIDSQQFSDTVSYTNTNQPNSPASVSLEPAGNEVLHAAWSAVDDADGYAVRIYQQSVNGWVDTGFGYDLGKNTTSIDMALTVGGQAENGTANLSADETYKIGVRAYRTIESGKYYSTEAESLGQYLAKYTPLELSLAVNGASCTPDENGVYHAYVDGRDDVLTVSCAATGTAFKVTRMDTDAEIPADTTGGFPIPAFEGSLLFKIDGISGRDVTSVFLLVDSDMTPPVLTLSAPVFYADQTTGQYTVTGTADAGSLVLCDGQQDVYAGSDGTFTVSGQLEEQASGTSFYLAAQDSAGNISASQLALVSRQNRHTVTVNGSYAASSGSGTYAAGETVTVSAGTRTGWQFSGWTTDSGIPFADASAPETTFQMHDDDVTVTANWTRSGGTTGGGSSGGSSGGSAAVWPVTVPDTANGTVSVSPKNAAAGTAVTITAKPDAGYVLDSLTVTDSNGKTLSPTDTGNGTYTFKMPSGKVTVRAAFTPAQDFFTDVTQSDYFYEAVKWAADKSITSGVSPTLFAPHAGCTRAQIVTFLWRAAGSPEPKALSRFTDVPADAYYAKAVAWAVENGITIGTSETTFGPDLTCTRAHSVTFLYRAEKAAAVSGDTAFTDVDANAYYADAVKWAVENGITNGISSSLFGPDRTCTRAQIVTLLYRTAHKNISA